MNNNIFKSTQNVETCDNNRGGIEYSDAQSSDGAFHLRSSFQQAEIILLNVFS